MSRKVSISVQCDRTVNVAGAGVTGRVVIRNPFDSYLCENVFVYILGKEEVHEEGHFFSRQLLHEKKLLLSPVLPSPATSPHGSGNSMILQKGKLTIPFLIPTPDYLPSSLRGPKARVTYILGCVLTQARASRIVVSRDCTIVEKLSSAEYQTIQDPIYGHSQKKLIFGGEGEIGIRCGLHKSIYKAGDIVYASLVVDNKTKRKIDHLKTFLVQKTLLTIPDQEQVTKEKIIAQKLFSGEDFVFPKNDIREVLLDISLPNEIMRSQKTVAVKISFYLRIELHVKFGKNPSVEMNLEICHPASLEPPPISSLFADDRAPPPVYEEDYDFNTIVRHSSTRPGLPDWVPPESPISPDSTLQYIYPSAPSLSSDSLNQMNR